MVTLHNLNAAQLDAIREVASIGAGHASTALAQMTGRHVMINVPSIIVADRQHLPEELGDPRAPVAATWMQVLGDLTGRTAVVLPATHAKNLCTFLLEREPDSAQTFDEMERSTLKEVGNIVCAAYLNALSSFMGMMLLPSAPSLEIDDASRTFRNFHLFPDDYEQIILVAVSEFLLVEEPIQELRGQLLLHTNRSSLRTILKALKIA